ncbi:MAG: OB-fold domain-containing protein [Chloroflexi bacterium]|nr:OB-fold domain-containing protein [Chloroflexota bacterium]
MAKLIPVPDDFSKPFWDAINEKRLTVQNCTSCNTLQYPPKSTCTKCGSESLEWKDTSGKGHILSFFVTYDGRYQRRIPDQPYNVAVVTLDEDPGINFYANLEGIPVKQVPIGAAVEVVFEEVGPGQLIHDWKLV